MSTNYKTCDECGSTFIDHSSKMQAIFSECAHVLYGYPRCEHDFVSSKCVKCGWDGSVSDYVESKRINGN